MKPFEDEKKILPDYPRTRHLPYQPNASRNDLIATEKEAKIIFESPNVYVEEKIDGANLGVTWVDDGPIIRNRSHILRKGYRKETAAKMQFASTWSWMYDRRELFENLKTLAGEVSVFGEWMYAQHSIHYDRLPACFVAFDLFSHDDKDYIDTGKARGYLESSGFQTTPLLHHGPVKSYKTLAELLEGTSKFSTTTQREGVYIKVSDGARVTHRFKMVRKDFIAGEHWSGHSITRNQIIPEVS